MPEYRVQQGDCLTTIALRFGVTVKSIWEHVANADLSRQRHSPNVLRPGDVLFVPEPEQKEISRATEKRHTFVRKGSPAKLRLRLMERDKPRKNEPYSLMIDGHTVRGTTDEDGRITCNLPPDARKGVLSLKDGKVTYVILLGHLDPVEELTGVQGRLKSLGYYAGPVDGELSDRLRQGIKAFQKGQGLDETGEMDTETRDGLKSAFGS